MRRHPAILRERTSSAPAGRAKSWTWLLFLVLCWLAAMPAMAEPLPVVRIGVLKFGTVNWELDVIRRHGLDRQHGFALEPTELETGHFPMIEAPDRLSEALHAAVR